MTKKELIKTLIECLVMIFIVVCAVLYCKETHFVIPKGIVYLRVFGQIVPVDRTCFIIVIAPIVLTIIGYVIEYITKDIVHK